MNNEWFRAWKALFFPLNITSPWKLWFPFGTPIIGANEKKTTCSSWIDKICLNNSWMIIELNKETLYQLAGFIGIFRLDKTFSLSNKHDPLFIYRSRGKLLNSSNDFSLCITIICITNLILRYIYDKKCLSLHTKIRHYNTVVKSSMLYASDGMGEL